MSHPGLGRLERVDLRSVWGSESGDFTPWLARDENIRLLGETIGMVLEVESRERSVGPFSADILCKNTVDDTWVLIENQLERTDHTHLGQLLTYAAGLEAVTIVWVSPKFTEEHRAALDWLNEITGEKFSFFGLEIEVFRIGDSLPAPKFNVVAKPNDWSRDIRLAAASTTHSEAKQIQLAFWTDFRKFMEECGSPIQCQKPAPGTSMFHALGRSGCHLVSIATTWSPDVNPDSGELRVQIQLDSERSKAQFEALGTRREEIEQIVGVPLAWVSSPDTRRCRIYIRSAADLSKTGNWPGYFQWLREWLERFHRVFAPLVRELP